MGQYFNESDHRTPGSSNPGSQTPNQTPPPPPPPIPNTPNQTPPNPNFPNQGYPNQGYPNQGYPNQGYPNQGYPNQGYPNQGYSNQGYSNQGYPNQGYSNQGYSNQGYPNQGYPNQGYSNPNYVSSFEEYDFDRERNGFVTFWLWLSVIATIYVVGKYIIYDNGVISDAIKDLRGWLELADKMSTMQSVGLWSTIITGIGCLIGYIQLFSWKKSGFWIICTMAILDIAAACYIMSIIDEIKEMLPYIGNKISNDDLIISCVRSIGSVAILFAILQIKRNGKSCWEQLD